MAQDDAEAVGWERRAAEQGNAQAQHNRGVSYRDGLGVVQDYGEAVRWFRRAADQGTLTRSTTSAGCTRTAEGRGVTTKKPRGGIAVWPTRETRLGWRRRKPHATCPTTSPSQAVTMSTIARVALPVAQALRLRVGCSLRWPLRSRRYGFPTLNEPGFEVRTVPLVRSLR